MRTANPALGRNTFRGLAAAAGRADVMTIDGTVNRTFILFLCLMVTAVFTWKTFMERQYAMVNTLMMIGFIAGAILALITIFKKTTAPVTAPLYALAEGLALGGISGMFELRYPGIVIQAVALTFGTLFCMLFAYRSGLIRPTKKFMLGVVAATGAVCLVYLASFVLGFFGVGIPYIHGSGPIGIGFSLVVVTIAALNLVLDFGFIEQGSSMGAPKYMEWYAAFGLMMTLIWLYLEILRLLVKLRSRD